MNFACMTSAPVCTRKNIKTSKKLSPEMKERRNYIRSHNFSIHADPSGMCSIEISDQDSDDGKILVG